MNTLEVEEIFLCGWRRQTAGNGKPDDVNRAEGRLKFLAWLEAEETENWSAGYYARQTPGRDVAFR